MSSFVFFSLMDLIAFLNSPFHKQLSISSSFRPSAGVRVSWRSEKWSGPAEQIQDPQELNILALPESLCCQSLARNRNQGKDVRKQRECNVRRNSMVPEIMSRRGKPLLNGQHKGRAIRQGKCLKNGACAKRLFPDELGSMGILQSSGDDLRSAARSTIDQDHEGHL
jgi:hypothetical protein